MKITSKKEREEILLLFLSKSKLKFSDIERELNRIRYNTDAKSKVRSNMVAYHIERLKEEGLLEKEREYYCLTKEAERYIPFLSEISTKETELVSATETPPVLSRYLFMIRIEKSLSMITTAVYPICR